MNCKYKIKIVGDLFFRGKLLKNIYQQNVIDDINDIKDIMNQFDYIKKVNIVTRTIIPDEIPDEILTEILTEFVLNIDIFECLCNRELNLKELREFVKKLKRANFRSHSIVSFIGTKTIPNVYIYQISFKKGKQVFLEKPKSKRKSTYRSCVIYEDKAEAESKAKAEAESKAKAKAEPKFKKCNSCGGKGVGLVTKNGFCEHCNRTKKLYWCSLCNQKFSTNSGRDMHSKMKHKESEGCGSEKVIVKKDL